MNSTKILLAAKVGDFVESKNIDQMWQDHFSVLLNSVHNVDSKKFVKECIKHRIADNEIVTVLSSVVLDSLEAVKFGKAAGINGLSAEHFVCAHIGISVHLSLFIYIYVDS